MAIKFTEQKSHAKDHSNSGSIGDFQSMFTAPASFNQAGELLKQFTESFDEAISKIGNGQIKEYRILPIDTTSINGTVQLLAMYSKQAEIVSFYTFILEGTLAGELQPRVIQSGMGMPEITIPTVTSDLYTREMSAYVADRIAQVAGVDAAETFDAGALVIANSLQPTELTNIHAMIWRASNAVQSVFTDGDENAPRVNIYRFRGLEYNGRVDFNPGQGMTSSNLPVRRDVALSVTANEKNKTNDTNALSRNQIQLARIGAYLDLRYVGPSQVPNVMHMNMLDEARVFAGTLVITDTNTQHNQISLELQLFALAEFLQLSRGQTWMNMLRPAFDGDNEVARLRSLKGIHTELGDLVKSPDAPDFNYYEMLSQVTYPNLIHVLHVGTASDLSWVHNFFRLAGNGVREAEEAILAAADNLTNGKFGNLFPDGERIATVEQDRVVCGYYNTEEGIRDLRHIDYLAMLNLYGETDMELVQEFGNTFLPQHGPMEQRVAKRIDILRRVFDHNLVITGLEVPVIIHPKFLATLGEAIRACDVNVSYHEDHQMHAGTDRSYLGLLNYAIDPTSSALYSSPYGNMGGGNWGMNQFSGQRFI